MSHPPIDSQITFLYANDLAQTAQFYEETIGLTLKRNQDTCRIYQVSKDGYLGFCQREHAGQPPSDPPHVIMTIVTHSVDEWHSYCQERNIQPERKPATNPKFDIYHFFLRDPNGYLLEIQQFLYPF
jgi:catechol 2,3-dioxygenase-like lactoylglutathione lyase family enzyme